MHWFKSAILAKTKNCQNGTFEPWLPKRPIFGRNRNLTGSMSLLSLYFLAIVHKVLLQQCFWSKLQPLAAAGGTAVTPPRRQRQLRLRRVVVAQRRRHGIQVVHITYTSDHIYMVKHERQNGSGPKAICTSFNRKTRI